MKRSAFDIIGLIGKRNDPKVQETAQLLGAFLKEQNLHILVDETIVEISSALNVDSVSRETIGEQSDLIVVIGGDGTLLCAARALIDYNVPIVGINLGRLGFLVDISSTKVIGGIKEILQGNYFEEARCALQFSVYRDEKILCEGVALNDVVIHKWNMARMIELETLIDGRYVNTQRSDGLIISTPTGSTAYALSGGGPILYPTLNAMALVPICPHTLSNRPIVISGDSNIEIIVTPEDQEHVQITWDGQNSYNLKSNDRVKIRKYLNGIKLIHPEEHDHYEVLRAKLRWG